MGTVIPRYVRRHGVKRDMDLVRRILMELADSDVPLDAAAFTDASTERATVGYHFEIMQEAGLIVASFLRADGDPYYHATAIRLTWEGNDFLASVKSEGIWAKVKMAVAKSAGDVPLSVFKQVATKLCCDAALAQAVGMP